MSDEHSRKSRKRKELIDLYFAKFSKRRMKYYEPDSQEVIPPTPQKGLLLQATQSCSVHSTESSTNDAAPASSSSALSFHQSENTASIDVERSPFPTSPAHSEGSVEERVPSTSGASHSSHGRDIPRPSAIFATMNSPVDRLDMSLSIDVERSPFPTSPAHSEGSAEESVPSESGTSHSSPAQDVPRPSTSFASANSPVNRFNLPLSFDEEHSLLSTSPAHSEGSVEGSDSSPSSPSHSSPAQDMSRRSSSFLSTYNPANTLGVPLETDLSLPGPTVVASLRPAGDSPGSSPSSSNSSEDSSRSSTQPSIHSESNSLDSNNSGTHLSEHSVSIGSREDLEFENNVNDHSDISEEENRLNTVESLENSDLESEGHTDVRDELPNPNEAHEHEHEQRDGNGGNVNQEHHEQPDGNGGNVNQEHHEQPDENEENVNQEHLEQPDENEGNVNQEYRLLRRIADDNNFFDNITFGVSVSPADLLYMCHGLAKQNKFTNKAFCDAVKLLNTIFTNLVLPRSADLLDKLVMDKTGVQYHFYCKDCTKYFGKLDYRNVREKVCDNENCRAVNKISDLRIAHYFVMFDVMRAVESLLGRIEVRNALLKPSDAVANGQFGFLSDLYDGSMYKNFAALDSNSLSRVISFLFCTDGALLFQSSKNSIWPVMLAVNELPVKVRMKNIILCGLWFGKLQPPMDLLLEPVVSCFIRYSEGFPIHVGNEEWLLKAFIIGCVVDSGARGKAQGIKSHGVYDSCNWCLIHGTYLNCHVRYPLTEVCPRKRVHERLVQLQRELANQNMGEENQEVSDDEVFEDNHEAAAEEGVTCVSPLINLPQFDMVNGFFVEPMHLLHLGVTKMFILKWLGDVNEEWYIKGHEEDINERISLLKPPLEFRRMPRLLDEKLRWKAREFENWLLLLVVVVLKGILPDKYLKLWLLFSQAIYLLSQNVVSYDHVNLADALLKRFIALTQEYYGEACMVFNIHLLYHLAEHCARWGPLWSSSAYCFENYNGFLKNIIRSQQGIPNQVLRAISWELSMKILEPRVSAKALEYVRNLPSKKPQGFYVDGCSLYGESKLFSPTENERWLVERRGCNVDSCEIYGKLLKNGCIFSRFCVQSRTNNSVAQLNDGNIIVIHKIIYDRDQEKIFLFASNVLTETVLNVPVGLHLDVTDHLMRKVTHIEEELLFIPVHNVKIVCFRANFDYGDYVAPLPNAHNVF